jgi:hypothetical protein
LPLPQLGKLEVIRLQIEEGFEVIGAVMTRCATLVAVNWLPRSAPKEYELAGQRHARQGAAIATRHDKRSEVA